VPRRDQVVQGVEPAAHSTSHGGPPGTMAQQHAAVASELPQRFGMSGMLHDQDASHGHVPRQQSWMQEALKN